MLLIIGLYLLLVYLLRLGVKNMTAWDREMRKREYIFKGSFNMKHPPKYDIENCLKISPMPNNLPVVEKF